MASSKNHWRSNRQRVYNGATSGKLSQVVRDPTPYSDAFALQC